MASVNKVLTEVRGQKFRSVWDTGVKKYAIELLEEVKENRGGSFNLTQMNYKATILNGARDWKQYSWGGGSLIFNEEIAKRLSTKSELAITRNGQLRPNSKEDWMDVQARALNKASSLIYNAIVSVSASEKTAAKKKATKRK